MRALCMCGVLLLLAIPLASICMRDPPTMPKAALRRFDGDGWSIEWLDYSCPTAWLWRARHWIYWFTR